jgi:CBS domain-containing protein
MKTVRDQGQVVGEPQTKKPRIGVGSSVTTLTRHATDDFALILSKTRVERLLPKGRKIYVAERTETLPQAFQKLVDRNVLSLPVLNHEGKYHGFVDMLDIVKHVMSLFGDVEQTTMADLEKLFLSEERFTKTQVHDVIPYPLQKMNPFHPILRGFSLYTAWETLALTGVHRVPVIDEEATVVDVVTQSMLIDFLWQNLEFVGEAANVPVSELGSNNIPLVVKGETKAIMAFQQMVQKNVSGVAVIDDNGKLVDNISLRDLKAIRPDAKVFWRLWNTVTDFKLKVREEFPGHHIPGQPLAVTETDTLWTVVEMMATKHVHRVFVVDSRETMRPVRVLSQTDILRELLRGKVALETVDKGKNE